MALFRGALPRNIRFHQRRAQAAAARMRVPLLRKLRTRVAHEVFSRDWPVARSIARKHLHFGLPQARRRAMSLSHVGHVERARWRRSSHSPSRHREFHLSAPSSAGSNTLCALISPGRRTLSTRQSSNPRVARSRRGQLLALVPTVAGVAAAVIAVVADGTARMGFGAAAFVLLVTGAYSYASAWVETGNRGLVSLDDSAPEPQLPQSPVTLIHDPDRPPRKAD